MYFYIYDQFVQEKKYQSLLAKIENRLTDLEIQGKVGRHTSLKNPKKKKKKAVADGANTIVAVGDDHTVGKIIDVLAYFPNVCLGIIPVGSHLKIARTLGIGNGIEACNILASRIIKKIDLGKIKNKFFLSQVEIPSKNISLTCDDSYTIYPPAGSTIFIYNFNYWSDNHLANPSDGLLETVILNKKSLIPLSLLGKQKSNFSIFFNKKIKVDHPDQPVEAKMDDRQIIKTPFLVEIATSQIKVIVGKERTFA